MKSSLTPLQFLLVLLILPVVEYGVLELLNLDKHTVFLFLAVIPLLMLVARTGNAIFHLLK